MRNTLNYEEEITVCQEKLPSKPRKPLQGCTALKWLIPCKPSLDFRDGFGLRDSHSDDLRQSPLWFSLQFNLLFTEIFLEKRDILFLVSILYD